MYQKEELEKIKIEIKENEEKIKKIRERNNKLKKILYNQKQYNKNYTRTDFKNTLAFKKFGKRQKELNEIELKELKREQIKVWRQKHKK